MPFKSFQGNGCKLKKVMLFQAVTAAQWFCDVCTKRSGALVFVISIPSMGDA